MAKMQGSTVPPWMQTPELEDDLEHFESELKDWLEVQSFCKTGNKKDISPDNPKRRSAYRGYLCEDADKEVAHWQKLVDDTKAQLEGGEAVPGDIQVFKGDTDLHGSFFKDDGSAFAVNTVVFGIPDLDSDFDDPGVNVFYFLHFVSQDLKFQVFLEKSKAVDPDFRY